MKAYERLPTQRRAFVSLSSWLQDNRSGASLFELSLTMAEQRPKTWRSVPKTPTAAIFVALIGLLFTSCPGEATEQHINLNIQAGQTYTLLNLAPDSTPEVRFTSHHPFILQCPATDRCVILGTESGEGTVRTLSKQRVTIIYDVKVSAITQPGKPLEPAHLPSTAGTMSRSEGGSAHPEESVKVSTEHSGPAHAVDPPTIQGQTPPLRYTQNPVVKELEVPRVSPLVQTPIPSSPLALMEGSSRLLDFSVPLRRVSIADTAVADVQVVAPNQIMLIGHKAGFTTLVTWDQFDNYREQTIRVDRGGPQEVQLNVVVAELDRSKLEQQGIDISLAFANAGVSVVGLPGGVATPYNPNVNLSASGGPGTIVALPPSGVLPNSGSLIPLLLSPSISYGVAIQTGQVTTNSFMQLLEQHSLAKILAEPRLIAESGQPAQFLSGGEIPIVISQALNTSIVFKQYGASVKFIPTVIDGAQGEIDLRVSPELSEPDYTQGVQLFGFTVPAFVTRRAQTEVRLRQNETLIIAGLILDTNRSELHKVPYLGDVPYLGAFFRHTYWSHVKSELVMTVTPQIVQPIPAGAPVGLPIERGQMTAEEVRTKPLSAPDVTRPRFP